jgi:amino acid transporter
MASAAFVVDLIVIGSALVTMNAEQWEKVLSHLSLRKEVSSYELLVGFSAAWLAFSGLESISQLSPAMRFPLRRTTRLAMAVWESDVRNDVEKIVKRIESIVAVNR